MDCSPRGSSVHGILQARTLECVNLPFSRGSSWLRDRTGVSGMAGRFFTVWAITETPPLDLSVSVDFLGSARGKEPAWNARQHTEKQRHYFANKGPSSQGYGFSSSHVWMWELDYKESWTPKNWWFWIVVLEKTLESPLDCKEIQPVHPKGDQSWVFIGRTDSEAETPILWPPDVKS